MAVAAAARVPPCSGASILRALYVHHPLGSGGHLRSRTVTNRT